ncbi:MAG: hypothetical protein AAGC57_20180 [Pseudomonadota bacterium]
MPPNPYPARLHALIARQAMVIRRGPAERVAACLRDMATDRVTLGQWLKGRIYERRAAISPDGRHWIYFAATHKHWEETGGTWTALARVPWLTALNLWAEGDAWSGGGGFMGRHTHWLNGGRGAMTGASRLAVAVAKSPLGAQRNKECLGI